MCIIIDANVASLAFRDHLHADARPVRDWIDSGDGRVVYGGQLAQELFEIEAGRRWLLQATRAGRAIQVPDADVSRKQTEIDRSGLCESDDSHVIALAQVSGARLLYSNDTRLHRDFRNRHLISRPRGSIYQTLDHADLLRKTVCRS